MEGLDLAAAQFLDASHALFGLAHMAALCRLLPERDPHPQIHAALEGVLDTLLDAHLAGVRMARFELQLLSELGFGLDLGSCAATGTTAELVYISPKSGRAVSRAAGEPWRDKLMRLPAFLAADGLGTPPSAADLADAFVVTGFFLLRHVLEPRTLVLPEARASFVKAVVAALERAPAAW
jgi:DNA repair protein RecO (recombination protein O)